ncbi:hypothetical protein FSP39_018955 [Pinctada imbricata]|uniref:DDB1- and CUL4-associated factor 12 beta-propeller domain-containing protein n=1 Tax=Pinctada imbricata TaxID=66713 RepID=A0AA88YFD9_PINIB|nr:hypothetical protein FSP39_018955 [Pinctada imbricata]
MYNVENACTFDTESIHGQGLIWRRGSKFGRHSHCSNDFELGANECPNTDIFRYIQARQYGGRSYRVNKEPLVSEFVSQQIPNLVEEREFKMGRINKIFTSHWLDDKQVAFGTKCNKGAEHTNDLAVYMLPTFDPVMVGEGGHTDWIFDMQWIDDEFIVTGSRDSKLALWRVDEEICDVQKSDITKSMPDYTVRKPEISTMCEKAQKVRALSYNDDRKELAVLSLNAYFHLWDVETFTAKSCRKLFHTRENVCMALSKEKCLFAIGSQSHINLVDPRSPNTLTTIISKYRGQGVRSVTFRDNILTIGTGVGVILFFDINAGKYLESSCSHITNFTVGRGWLLRDETYRDFFMDSTYPSAIYTHQYDKGGTRLFAAGGPLPAGLWGNYAGLWY